MGGKLKSPETGRFAEDLGALMQDRSERFAPGLVELGLDGFWAAGLLLEALQPFLLESMDRIANGLRCTSQIARNFRWSLSSAGCQQNLTSTQGKGMR
jgi:hypothetical protein